MPLYRLIVLTNPVEGREDEYNTWYDDTHLADVLRIPGIIGAQRFRRADVQRAGGDYPWGYLAIYDCDTDSPQRVIDSLKERGGTALMQMTDALAESRFVCFFEPITDLRSA